VRRLRRIWNAWRQAPPGDVNPAPPSRHKPADVPSEYRAFYDYLERRYATTVVLTFLDIEALLGFSLPNAARADRDWWTGTIIGADRHSKAWAAARRTATPNLAAQTVAFDRVLADPESTRAKPPA
jgi:hypothetical protein